MIVWVSHLNLRWCGSCPNQTCRSYTFWYFYVVILISGSDLVIGFVIYVITIGWHFYKIYGSITVLNGFDLLENMFDHLSSAVLVSCLVDPLWLPVVLYLMPIIIASLATNCISQDWYLIQINSPSTFLMYLTAFLFWTIFNSDGDNQINIAMYCQTIIFYISVISSEFWCSI